MYNKKGVPNRWRINKYRKLAKKVGLIILKLEPISKAKDEKLDIVIPKLQDKFKNVLREELACKDFWIVLEN